MHTKLRAAFSAVSGFDALNSLYMTTYEIDEKHKTKYFERFVEYLKKIQEENFHACRRDDRSEREIAPSDPASRPIPTVHPRRGETQGRRGGKGGQGASDGRR